MKKRLLTITFVCLLTVVGGLIFWGCEKQNYVDDEALSAAIASSSEMEEYIIAGYEMHAALKEFEQVLNSIDFSKLDFVPDTDGKLVMRLPIQSLTFEARLGKFNDKKSALRKRYPQIASMPRETCNNMIRTCVQKSVRVSSKLLDMNVSVFQPNTKIRPESFEDSMEFLSGWMGVSNYVEAVIIVYRDGSSSIYIDPRNTPTTSYYPPLSHVNGTDLFYYPGGGNSSPILFIGHTHQSGPDPSAVDCQTAIDGLIEAIYYDGNFYPFDKNGRY